ncbi:hypothetical protein E0493_14540 [Roseomonas sp. M0104]|uniref:Lipoprotein n=1 Tax=Teichococcus coralli TaxID=2545983 RepID=A0A845BGV5_9PROT|nr:hypothetical protein [Pseudoroseomonas coralli]MXP64567.1 hypothetical protein [Pseudoroseomonas coralli]
MRLHPTIILAVFLASCAGQPSPYGWSPAGGWRTGSGSEVSPASRQRRPNPSRAAPAPESQEPTAYRVASDGTVGCADPQALRALRELRSSDNGTPRALAEAHRNGHCMTVFQVSRWRLDSAEGDMMRLSLLHPNPGQRETTLYFMRGEVEAQP